MSSPSCSTPCRRPAHARDASSNEHDNDEADHTYYEAIDAARCAHASRQRRGRADVGMNASVIEGEIEERVRARRFRSHEPSRWRLAAARFDFPLYPWGDAIEGQLQALEGEIGGGATAGGAPPRAITCIQRPPLAFEDATARAGAVEAGAAAYFSIEDFERAILDGELEVKSSENGEVLGRLHLNQQQTRSRRGDSSHLYLQMERTRGCDPKSAEEGLALAI